MHLKSSTKLFEMQEKSKIMIKKTNKLKNKNKSNKIESVVLRFKLSEKKAMFYNRL